MILHFKHVTPLLLFFSLLCYSPCLIHSSFYFLSHFATINAPFLFLTSSISFFVFHACSRISPLIPFLFLMFHLQCALHRLHIDYLSTHHQLEFTMLPCNPHAFCCSFIFILFFFTPSCSFHHVQNFQCF